MKVTWYFLSIQCTMLTYVTIALWVLLLMLIPLTCTASVGSVSGASASSGELEREINEGSTNEPVEGIPSDAWESCGITTDRWGLTEGGKKANKTKHNIISHMTKVLQVMIKIDLNFRPLQRILGACFLSWRGHTVASAAFDSLAVLQLTAWAMWAGARLREVWTH